MASPSSDTPGFTQPNNAPSTSQAAGPSTSAAAAPAPETSSSPAPQAESSTAAPSTSAAGPATTEQQQGPQPTTSAAQGVPQSSSSQAAAASSVAASSPAGAVTITSTLAASAPSSNAVSESPSSSAAVAVSTVTVSSSSSASSAPAVPTTTSSTPPAPSATLRSGSLHSTSSSTLGSTGSRASNGTEGSSRSLSAGAIGGIAGGAVGLLLLLGLGVWAYRKRKARKDRDEWPLPPPRDMIATSGTGYGGGWDDKPTAGAGVASSSNLGYSGEKPGFNRSNSALYVPGLPAHYPSYGRRTSQRPLSPSSSGPSTPGLGPAYSYDQPLAPMMMPAVAGQGQNYYRPASPAQQQGGTGDFAQGPFLFQHDRSPGGSAVGSASGSRSSTPVVRGVAGGSNSDLRGEAVMQGSSSDVATGRQLPPPIQTTGLNDISGPTNNNMDNLGGSAPSTPRSGSRHSYNPQHASQGYAQPYYPSSTNAHHSWSNPGSGLRTSYSGRSVHLQMPTPLDPSTSRQGYLSPPTSPRAGSMYGLNEFGAYGNPGVARSSRPGSGSGSGSRGSGSYSPSREGSVHSSTRLQGKPSSALAGEGNGHRVSHQPSTSSSLASGPSGSGEGEEDGKR